MKVPTYEAKETSHYRPTLTPQSIASGMAFEMNPQALTGHKRTEAKVEEQRRRLLSTQGQVIHAEYGAKMALAKKLGQIRNVIGNMTTVDARTADTVDATRFNEAMVNSSNDLSGVITDLKALDDPDDAANKYGKAAQDIYTERSKRLKGPSSQRFAQEFGRMAIRGQGEVLQGVRKTATDRFRATLTERTQKDGVDYINAPTQGQKDDILESHRWMIEQAVKRGDLSGEQGTRVILDFEGQAAMADIKQLIETNPYVALETLQSGNYPSLGMANQLTLTQMAKDNIAKEELKGAYEGLLSMAGGDASAVLEMLAQDPQAQQQTGLDDERYNSLVDLLEASAAKQQRVEKDKQAQRHDAAVNIYYRLMMEGDFENAAVAVLNADDLSNKEKFTMMNAAKKNLVTTDDLTWGAAVEGILTGQIKTTADVLAAGVKVDRYEEAMAKIDKVKYGKNPVNVFNAAVRDFEAIMKDAGEEDRLPLIKADFVLGLNYLMEEKGYTINSPEVLELARGLTQQVVKQERWYWVDKKAYVFEDLIEQRPWLTREPATETDPDIADEIATEAPTRAMGGPVYLPQARGQGSEIPTGYEDLAATYGAGYVDLAIRALTEEGRETTPEEVEDIIRFQSGDIATPMGVNVPQGALREIVTALESAGRRVDGDTILQVWEESTGLQDRYPQGKLYVLGEDPGLHVGMVEPGNIDIRERTTVAVPNADGTTSSVRSISFHMDGMEVLIPTVIPDGRGGWKVVSDDEAVERFMRTGEHLGMFDSIDAATKYAMALHNQQEAAGRKQ